MPTCNWSLLCADAEPETGTVHADEDTALVVTFGSGGKLAIDHGDDGKTITAEGDMTIGKRGDQTLRFVGGMSLDGAGVGDVSGKLVLDLSKTATVDVSGDLDPHTGEAQAGLTLTIRF